MRDSILLYRSQCDALRGLEPEVFKAAVTALWDYGMDGTEPVDPEIRVIWLLCKPLIDRNNKNAANRQKTDDNESERIGTTHNETERIGTNRNESEPKEKYKRVNIKENHSPKGECQKKSARRFTPPTLQDVTAYVAEKGCNVDPERFCDYYGSQNWRKSNGQPLTDWKAAVRNWNRSQRQEEPPKRPQGQEKTAQANRFINYQQRDVDLDAIITQQERKSLGRV